MNLASIPRFSAKILFATVALAVAIALAGCSSSAISKEDAPQAIANSLSNQTAKITFKSDDVDETVKEALATDPRLFYYYHGYNGTYAQDGTAEIELVFRNQDTPLKSIRLMESASDLNDIVAQAVSEGAERIAIVSTSSDLDPENIQAAFDRALSDGVSGADRVSGFSFENGSSDYDLYYSLDIVIEWAQPVQA